MKKILAKKIVSLVALAMLTLPMLTIALPSNAANIDLWGGKKDDVQSGLGVGNRDPRDIIVSAINVAMGFLGIIAVGIILMGGFKWMTAQGNEKGVEEAQTMIKNGVIGLIIILAAFGIANFVVNSAMKVTS